MVSAGTSDISVAEEALVTAELMGNTVEHSYDVGVAGIHRLLANREALTKARVVIVCAGMEGALPSVVGGTSRSSGDCRSYQRRLWRIVQRPHRAARHAELVRVECECSEY